MEWGEDRFYLSGYRFFGDLHSRAGAPFTEEIKGTEDASLHRTERFFIPAVAAHPAGYRIPLPKGRYRVFLHFAEIYLREGMGRRTFDVVLEGQTMLAGYEPGKAGFATARREEMEVRVEDGFLDLEFVARTRDPKVSAIEVRRIGD